MIILGLAFVIFGIYIGTISVRQASDGWFAFACIVAVWLMIVGVFLVVGAR